MCVCVNFTVQLFSQSLFERMSPSQIDQCWNASEGIHLYMRDGISYCGLDAKCCLDAVHEGNVNIRHILSVQKASSCASNCALQLADVWSW